MFLTSGAASLNVNQEKCFAYKQKKYASSFAARETE